MGPNFAHLLSGRGEGTGPPPPLTVSLTVKRPFFFDDFPNCNSQILGGGKASFKESFLAPQTGTWAPQWEGMLQETFFLKTERRKKKQNCYCCQVHAWSHPIFCGVKSHQEVSPQLLRLKLQNTTSDLNDLRNWVTTIFLY